MAATAYYREYAPCEALGEYVRAFFCLSPPGNPSPGSRQLIREVLIDEGGPPGAPPLADSHVSMVFGFERAYVWGQRWRNALSAPRGCVIGPMSGAGSTPAREIPERVGISLRAGQACAVLGLPISDLADRVVATEDLWGAGAAGLAAELAEIGEVARIERLEAVLLHRLAQAPAARAAIDVPGLARCIVSARGLVRIEQLAQATGVSRQYLTRAFREAVGIGPKLFARLARFHAGLGYAGCGVKVDWAQVALELGFADQSHMIAEFREFSSLTPEILARQRWFHPFIERARSRLGPRSGAGAQTRS